jgi:anaerobic ribonucleoside-triphosphate reductase activating protein
MVFSGYTLAELMDPQSSEYESRLNFLNSIDLLVDGRYQQDNVDIDRPWVGSKNQEFHFLTERYSKETLFNSVKDGLEITVLNSGEVQINGWATDSQLENLLEKL